jgi:Tol biopolymer transport system component
MSLNITRVMGFLTVAGASALVLASGAAAADSIFGTPENLGPVVNSPADDGSPSISADGLELYFDSSRDGGFGGADIWVARRATTEDDWGEPENLGPVVNSPANEVAVSISADGLALYFCDWGDPRPGGLGEADLWVTTRASKDSPWGKPVNLGPTINSPGNEATPNISADGRELYFESDRPGGFGSDDIYVATRSASGEWGEPKNLGQKVNSAEWEHCPDISADGLTLFYDRKIPGDLLMSKRATLNDPWGEPVNLGHGPSDHWASSISADGSMMYFASKRPGGSGGNDIWETPVLSGVNAD